VEGELAALDPSKSGATEVVRELCRSLDLLEVVAGQAGALAEARSLAKGALGDLLVLSIARQDFAEAVAAFCAYFELYPRIEWRAGGRALALLKSRPLKLASIIGAVPPAQAESMPIRLRAGHGNEIALEIAIEGVRTSSGEVIVEVCRPILPIINTTVAQALFAVFALVFCEPIRRAKRLRLTGDTLEIDAGSGFFPAWGLSRPGAISLALNAPSAAEIQGPLASDAA
jgi:hypothetical protein